MSGWREELVGKFVWNPMVSYAGVVERAHGAGTYEDAQGRKVAAPVLEFEDGTSMVASDDREGHFKAMSRNAALLHELATKVLADATHLLARHAAAYGLDPKLSALVIATVLKRQSRELQAERKEPNGEPPEPVPAG